MRGVTECLQVLLMTLIFQLTRLMRGVTAMIREETALLKISTHTPHARRDQLQKIRVPRVIFISTHTPHARRDKSGG